MLNVHICIKSFKSWTWAWSQSHAGTLWKVAWKIRIPNSNLGLVPTSCKYTVDQVVWRIMIRKVRFRKLNMVPNRSTNKIMEIPTDHAECSLLSKMLAKNNVGLVPRSYKYTVNQVVWRIGIRKARFPKLNLVPKYRHRKNFGNTNRLS